MVRIVTSRKYLGSSLKTKKYNDNDNNDYSYYNSCELPIYKLPQGYQKKKDWKHQKKNKKNCNPGSHEDRSELLIGSLPKLVVLIKQIFSCNLAY